MAAHGGSGSMLFPFFLLFSIHPAWGPLTCLWLMPRHDILEMTTMYKVWVSETPKKPRIPWNTHRLYLNQSCFFFYLSWIHFLPCSPYWGIQDLQFMLCWLIPERLKRPETSLKSRPSRLIAYILYPVNTTFWSVHENIQTVKLKKNKRLDLLHTCYRFHNKPFSCLCVINSHGNKTETIAWTGFHNKTHWLFCIVKNKWCFYLQSFCT